MKTKLSPILTIIFFFSFFNLKAQVFDGELNMQDSSQIHLIVMKNGDSHIGHINGINDDKIELVTKKETEFIELSKVARISVKGSERVKYSLPAYNANHLFITPTAYVLPTGQSEYRTIYGIVHTWDKTVSKNVQIGLGASFPLFLGFRSKFTWDAGRKTRMGLGLNFNFVPLSIGNEWHSSSHYFLNVTAGSPNNHFNLGFNLYKLSDDLAESEGNEDGFVFTLTFGGRVRLSEHWQLLAENAISTVTDEIDVTLLPAFGACWFNERNSVEFGFKRSTVFNQALLPVLGTNTLAQLPFLSYSRRVY